MFLYHNLLKLSIIWQNNILISHHVITSYVTILLISRFVISHHTSQYNSSHVASSPASHILSFFTILTFPMILGLHWRVSTNSNVTLSQFMRYITNLFMSYHLHFTWYIMTPNIYAVTPPRSLQSRDTTILSSQLCFTWYYHFSVILYTWFYHFTITLYYYFSYIYFAIFLFPYFSQFLLLIMVN